MTRPIRSTIAAAFLAAAAAAVVLSWLLLPPRAVALQNPEWAGARPSARGAYHVHSTVSDGTGTLDEIGAAAAAAGLQFVILTDHGDGTRRSEPPQYRNGALVIEAVEVNTWGGHLVALGMTASPYPLAGAARAVLEDVHRLGGIGIAAHPGSPRPSLQWTDWEAPLDGLEWINADSEWRDEPLASLGRMLLTFPFRPAETVASMLDRPDAVMARWSRQALTARSIGLAGADAHARLGWGRQEEPYVDRWHLAVPSYRASFETFTTRVVLEAPLSGDAGRDTRAILEAVRRGRIYTVIDAVASPGALDFRATSGVTEARVGDELDLGEAVDFHIRVAAPAGSRTVLLRDGEPTFETSEAEARVSGVDVPGAYRIEVYAPDVRTGVPWLVSNPIYVGMREAHARAATAAGERPVAGERARPGDDWAPETSPASESVVGAGPTVDQATREWRFRLGGAVPGQYAALAVPIPGGLDGRDRVQLRAAADRPMRIWVQLRASSLGSGDRWGQSVYLDPQSGAEIRELFIDDFVSLGPTTSERPPLGAIDSLLLVVDTVNARPGSTGLIEIIELWLASPAR